MKKAFLAVLVISGTFGVAPLAHAQLAVIDGSNLAQNMQTAAQAVVAVEQLRMELLQLQQTYQMFTTPMNVTGLVPGLESQALENPMPTANALSGLLGGQTPTTGAAGTYYNQNHVYTPTDGSASSVQSISNANSIANLMGVATTNLAAVNERLQELPNLEADLNTATSLTQVASINGRIATESQFVQGQQAQAANLQVLAEEQQASQQQQQQEQFQQNVASSASEMQAAALQNGADQ